MNKPKYHEGQRVGVRCGCGSCVSVTETFIVTVISNPPGGLLGLLLRASGVLYEVDGVASVVPERWIFPLDDDDKREPGLSQVIDNLERYRETIKPPETEDA